MKEQTKVRIAKLIDVTSIGNSKAFTYRDDRLHCSCVFVSIRLKSGKEQSSAEETAARAGRERLGCFGRKKEYSEQRSSTGSYPEFIIM